MVSGKSLSGNQRVGMRIKRGLLYRQQSPGLRFGSPEVPLAMRRARATMIVGLADLAQGKGFSCLVWDTSLGSFFMS